MHLLYIDDSGDDGRSGSSTSHFVLGGLTIQDWNWHPLVKRIDDIASQYLGRDGSRTELHAYDMLAGKGAFRKISPNVREELFKAVLGEVGRKESRLSLFVVVVHKDSLPITRSVRVVSTLQLYQRFNSYLTRAGAYRQKTQERGMLICDEHTSRQQVQSLVAAIHSAGVPKQLTDNLVETAFFVESHQSRVLQLADLVCHAAYRFVTVQDDRFFPIVERKIDRDKKLGGGNHVVHYGFRYIASTPDAGLPGPLPFKELRVTSTTSLPAGSFLPVKELESELMQHGL